MTVTVRSFAKINLGLRIGAPRADGFHELLTVYQTIALHDVIRVSAERSAKSGSEIDIRCADPRVPCGATNTCYRIAEKAMATLGAKGRIVIEIEKKLPVQGGLGGGSSNAVATLIGLQRALKRFLPPAENLRIAAEVGSDLPLFLIGGTILGVGRGEQVYPLPDLPAMACVVVTPEIGVSTPKAFAEWDRLHISTEKLTLSAPSDRINELSREFSAWLSGLHLGAPSAVNAEKRRGRVENPLLNLVRAGIANDFEQVVFPEYPELREGKRALERTGAKYASLSGSGSTLFGLFASRDAAAKATARLRKQGWSAQATVTLPRRAYWSRVVGR
jgi:4-diphosphocytidyl-2-C-methyl-D-erythritol kinase